MYTTYRHTLACYHTETCPCSLQPTRYDAIFMQIVSLVYCTEPEHKRTRGSADASHWMHAAKVQDSTFFHTPPVFLFRIIFISRSALACRQLRCRSILSRLSCADFYFFCTVLSQATNVMHRQTKKN